MHIIIDLLLKSADKLKCKHLIPVHKRIEELGYYPQSDGYYVISEADHVTTDEFSMWLYYLPHTPSISPPYLVAYLVQHWRALAQ